MLKKNQSQPETVEMMYVPRHQRSLQINWGPLVQTCLITGLALGSYIWWSNSQSQSTMELARAVNAQNQANQTTPSTVPSEVGSDLPTPEQKAAVAEVPVAVVQEPQVDNSQAQPEPDTFSNTNQEEQVSYSTRAYGTSPNTVVQHRVPESRMVEPAPVAEVPGPPKDFRRLPERPPLVADNTGHYQLGVARNFLKGSDGDTYVETELGIFRLYWQTTFHENYQIGFFCRGNTEKQVISCMPNN